MVMTASAYSLGTALATAARPHGVGGLHALGRAVYRARFGRKGLNFAAPSAVDAAVGANRGLIVEAAGVPDVDVTAVRAAVAAEAR
jgi:hypothetical protein